jgi:DNA-binding NarL/FixJ family response regulator
MGSGTNLSLVIADDHAVVRAAVRRMLEAEGFEVRGEAADADEAVAVVAEQRPDVCLLDVHMPGSGIRAAEEISSRCPDTAVVMLTSSRDDEDLFGALRAGASGYLLKDTDPKRLAEAIRGALCGEAAMPGQLLARLIEQFRTGGGRRQVQLADRRGVELTEREWEVLDLMAEGTSTSAMADRLGVSPVTVRRHVSAILRKLEVGDRAAAVELVRPADS